MADVIPVKGAVEVQKPLPGRAVTMNQDPRTLYTSYPLSYLNGLPYADYESLFKGRIKNASDHRRYDVRVIIGGGTVAKGIYKFFDKPKDDTSEKSLDGGTTIAVKDESYTNMVESNKLEAGSTLIVESVQITVDQLHREFNAFAANSGEPSDATVTSTDTFSSAAHLFALNRATSVRFNLGRKLLAQGAIRQFPPQGGWHGAYGGATPEGFTQNGMGFAVPLREIVVLQNLYHFSFEMEFFRAVTFPMYMEIEVALCGVLLESVG